MWWRARLVLGGAGDRETILSLYQDCRDCARIIPYGSNELVWENEDSFNLCSQCFTKMLSYEQLLVALEAYEIEL